MPITGDDWKTLEPYLDEALELPETERARWLADLAAAQPEIAHAIAGLLAEQGRLAAESFLEGPAMVGLHAVAGAGLAVGHYTLEKPIGHGGMGTVWLARRNDGRFEGRAAVKLLNAALVGRPSALRFVREGSVLANLTHPHIAHLIDAGVAATGQPYLVLEYVEGVRIDQHCETLGLTPVQRVRLFLDVLAAVAHAHSHLVVHRDIKPSNILVTGDGVVKLLDFGIAALLTPDGEPGPLAALTREAGSALTPEYAAPEQLLNRPVTTATDVYALGLVLFVLLAGRHPMLVEGQSAVERVRTALDRESPRLSEVTAGTRIERTLRGDLDNIVAKALKLEPEERYATVAAFADDLRRYLANEPVQARADSLAYRASKFVSRHRRSVLAGTATALGLVALTAFSLAQMREARRQRDEAIYQTKRAEAESHFFTLMISAVGEGGKPLTLPEILDKGLVLLDKQYGDDPDFVVHTLINMSGRYMDAGDTDKEYAALVKAEGLARKAADPMLLAIVQCNTVETEIAAGRMAEAAARLQEGQQALALVDKPDVADAADCVHAAASLADAQGDTDGAIVLVHKALTMLAEAGRDRENRYNGLLSHASFLYGKQGRFVEALELDQQSLQIYEQTGREGTEGAQGTLHNIATALRGMGEIRGALAREGQLIEGLRADDPAHPIHPAVSSTYGALLARMGDTASGLRWLDRAISDAHANGNAYMEIGSRLNRSRVLVMAGRAAAAGAELDEVDRLARGNETSFRDVLQFAAVVRAEIQLSLGHPAKALATLAPVLAGIARPLRPGGGRHAGRSLIVASGAALAARRLEEAAQFAADAVEVMRLGARRPEASADVGEAYLALAEARLAGGDPSGAREAAAHAVESLTNGLDASHPLTRQAAALTREPEA